jgi:transposase
MPKKLEYQLSTEEEKAIQQLMKSPKSKVMRWATILYNLHLGATPQEVATANHVSLPMVYTVVRRYQLRGIEGLQPAEIPSRPHALNAEECQEVERVLNTDPRELGYGFTIWTSQRLQHYLQKHLQRKIAEATVRNTLNRLGYVYRRPKKSLKHVQDEQAVENFKELLSELKKEPNVVNLSSCLWMRVDLNSITVSDPAG